MAKLYNKKLKAMLGKVQKEAKIYSDGDGLAVRVSKAGKIRWQFRYKIDGKNKRFDLGDYPEISIVKARDLTRQYRTWLAEGLDPKLERDLQRSATLKPVSVKDALEYWLVEYAEDNRANVNRHRSQFNRHIYPYIGHLPVEQIETRHWIECFDRIRKGIAGKQKPAPVATGYIFQNAKQALRFCRVRRYATSRALDDLIVTDVGKKQRKKDRVLKQSELIDLWLEAERGKLFRPYYCYLVKLLIIFGSRTQEIRLSTWNEWDFDEMLWTVPAKHSKSGEKIIRPIPPEIVPMLQNLKQGNRGNDYVLNELKTTEVVSQQGKQICERLKHEPAWRFHDIRRTFATRLNELGVAPYIVEQMLGHSLGGVMAIYNKSQYLPEKKQALSMWIKHLEDISQSKNVTSITAARVG